MSIVNTDLKGIVLRYTYVVRTVHAETNQEIYVDVFFQVAWTFNHTENYSRKILHSNNIAEELG